DAFAVHEAVVALGALEVAHGEQHILEPERREQSIACYLECGRHGGSHKPRRRLEELELETVGIGNHAEAAAGLWISGSRELLGDRLYVRRFSERAVMSHRDRPAVGHADGDIADLPIGRQLAEQHEVALPTTKVLLVQRGG